MQSGRALIRAKALSGMLLACAMLTAGKQVAAQSGCSAGGYRITARRWDAVLKTGWELRQDCLHPEWPARLAAISSGSSRTGNGLVTASGPNSAPPQFVQPLLVRAGDPVRLWMQDERVRIEMNGVAEQSARAGERVVIRILHPGDGAALTVQRIAGIVRGNADVEMER
jgi:hypothetical protein